MLAFTLPTSTAALFSTLVGRACDGWAHDSHAPASVRVRVEITGSQKCRIVGKPQSVLMMTSPMIFTRSRRMQTQVVCVLKGLLEDGEILLADGRRFVSPKSVLYEHAEPPGTVPGGDEPNLLETRICQMHPSFRVIALANRPGYPFMVRATAVSVSPFALSSRTCAARPEGARPADTDLTRRLRETSEPELRI
jgi:hypothetical protein